VACLTVTACGGGGGGGGGTSTAPPPAAHIASIQIAGTPVVVFDHSRDKQEPYNLPDGQVTAWKESDGTVNLLIPSMENYRMRGPDLLHLTMDPHKIYSSATSGSHLPEDQHDYDHWLLGPYSQDGVHWFSLSESEWYACLLNGDCAQTGSNGLPADSNSWANTVNQFSSADGGASWTLNTVSGNHAAADVSYHWTGTLALSQHVYLHALNHTGVFGPSRLVQEDGWWYCVGSYIHRDFSQLSPATGVYEAPIDSYGYVLLRTADFTSPNGWQAWNGGNSFNPVSSLQFKAFLPQYQGSGLDASSPQLIHDTVSNSFVIIFSVYTAGSPVYYVTTSALAAPAWSDAVPIGGSAQLTTDAAGPVQGFDNENYVSIIDPASAGSNFEFTAGTPQLFYNTSPGSYGGDNLARDLYRVPLTITYSH